MTKKVREEELMGFKKSIIFKFQFMQSDSRNIANQVIDG